MARIPTTRKGDAPSAYRAETGPSPSPAGTGSAVPSPPAKTSDYVDTSTDSIESTDMSALRIGLLTIGAVGLQMAYGIMSSYGSPFLLSLGISKSTLSFVWIAGPLGGIIVQPILGVVSDNFRSPWGRRRPFILAASVATAVMLCALSWAPQTVRSITSLFGADPTSSAVKTAVAVYAVIIVYVADFAINALQASLRVFLVDGAPQHQQDAANAWISRFSGFSHIVCYYIGRSDLPAFFGTDSWDQFQLLCLVGFFMIIPSATLSVVTTKERYGPTSPPADAASRGDRYAPLGLLSRTSTLISSAAIDIIRTARDLPPTVWAVCRIQFLAWLAWFPFLIYSSTYIGHLYVDPFLIANPDASPAEVEAAWLRGTRAGSAALLCQAFITSTTSVVAPMLVKPLIRSPGTAAGGVRPRQAGVGRWIHDLTHKPDGSQRYPLTLNQLWIISNIMYATLAWMTLFVSTTLGGGIIIALMGVPWAISCWVPFAFVGSDAARRKQAMAGVNGINNLNINSRDDLENAIAGVSSTTALLNSPNPTGSFGSTPSTRPGSPYRSIRKKEPEAGVIFGIHNVFISGPQIVSAIACSLIFAVFQRPRNVPGDDSVGWTLRITGLGALAAAMLCRKLSAHLR